MDTAHSIRPEILRHSIVQKRDGSDQSTYYTVSMWRKILQVSHNLKRVSISSVPSAVESIALAFTAAGRE